MNDYNNKKYKVAIYIRVANKETVIEDSAIERQKYLARTYLKKKKGIISKDYYIDNGFSGSKYDRPAFNRMIKDIKSGKVNLVVFKNLDRLSRKMNIINKIDYLKKKYDVDFVSIDGDIDTIYKIFQFNLMKIISDKEREQNKKRSIMVQRYKEKMKQESTIT
jgi:site-specific DNA recombinase